MYVVYHIHTTTVCYVHVHTPHVSSTTRRPTHTSTRSPHTPPPSPVVHHTRNVGHTRRRPHPSFVGLDFTPPQSDRDRPPASTTQTRVTETLGRPRDKPRQPGGPSSCLNLHRSYQTDSTRVVDNTSWSRRGDIGPVLHPTWSIPRTGLDGRPPEPWERRGRGWGGSGVREDRQGWTGVTGRSWYGGYGTPGPLGPQSYLTDHNGRNLVRDPFPTGRVLHHWSHPRLVTT